jgi:hypothetical protein
MERLDAGSEHAAYQTLSLRAVVDKHHVIAADAGRQFGYERVTSGSAEL